MKTANIKDNNQEYDGFILIENLTDLFKFYNEVTYGLHKESATNLVDRDLDRKAGNGIKHASDVITNTVENINLFRPKGVIYRQAEIMASYYYNLEKYISEGKKIAINPFNKVSYFTISDSAEVEIISSDTKYTKKDIRVKRWLNGAHWYAKIGLMDVVIDGEQKWNAKWVAQKKAEEFLLTL